MHKAVSKKFHADAAALGNGTAARCTGPVASKLGPPTAIKSVMVNESVASIYSASEVAREEYPNHDITVRGAVSIGRRLMDPLAELVKLDPKSIGVGQYQHDVEQNALKRSLDDSVVSCVNNVGVEISNTMAGVPLDGQGYYAGTFVGLLSPFALAVGLLSAAMFLMQGAAWLLLKTEGALQVRARRTALVGQVATLVLWVVVTIWSRAEAPALWDQFGLIPAWLAPVIAVLALAAFPVLVRRGRATSALAASASAPRPAERRGGTGLWGRGAAGV